MFKFTYKDYEDCWFSTSRYQNGNLSVEIWNNEVGPIVRVTVNPGILIPDEYLAIKNYSENDGVLEFLKELDIIVPDPAMTITSGYVFIPLYRLTEYGEEILKIFEI